MEDQSAPGTVLDPDDRCFQFDELGLYSPGAPATATHGYVTVNVNNATSETISLLNPETTYSMSIMVDGITYSNKSLDPCGWNWTQPVSSPTVISVKASTLVTGLLVAIKSTPWCKYTSLTARAEPTPSITGKQSYGYLTFESISLGEDSEVVLNCSTGSSATSSMP